MSLSGSTESPYKELDYYEETDAKHFAGREQDVHQLFSRVVTCRAFVLYGRSGLGKTSVLLAGLFPELRNGKFRPIYVRTLDEPLGDLKAAVLRDCGITADGESLRTAIANGFNGVVPVIVLDQFEEFFIRFREQPAKRAEFVRELAAVISDKSLDVRVIFSVREDYLAALDDLQRRLPNLFAQSYRLMPLSAFGAREAIIRPLEDVPYDEMLVTRLVDELAKFDFESARLQISCAEVYRTARERTGSELHLREDDLNTLGEELREEQASTAVSDVKVQASVERAGTPGALLEGIFQRYVRRTVSVADAKYPLVARLVLDEMVTRQETKYAISCSELTQHVRVNESELHEVLSSFVSARLVRERRRGNELWYELMHECLVPEIRRWLLTNEEFVTLSEAREVIVTSARRSGWRKYPSMLLSRELMHHVISPNRERLQLDATEVEFLIQSAIYARSEDLSFWSEKFGREETAILLRELLDSQSSEARSAAASAVQLLGFRDATLVEKCRWLALKADEPPEVQRAAGGAFAAVATDEQLAAIRSECRWWKNPRPVRELLADLSSVGRIRPACNPWFRWQARKRRDQRLIFAAATRIEQERRSGVRFGFFGGILWAATAAFVTDLFFRWLENPADSGPLLHIAWPMMTPNLFFGLIFGSVCGWSVGRAHARAEVLGRRPVWYRSVANSWVVFWTLYANGLVVVLGLLGTEYMLLVLVIMVPLTWLARCLIAGAVQLCRPCFQQPITTRDVVLWSVLTTLGLGVLITYASVLAAAPWLNGMLKEKSLFWMHWSLVTTILPFMIFVSNFTIAMEELHRTASPGDLLPVYRRRWWRTGFAIAAFSLFPLFLVAYGPSATPLFCVTRNLSQGAVEAHFHLWPHVRYFKLKAQPEDRFHITVPPDSWVVFGCADSIKPDELSTVMTFPKGVGRMSVSNPSGRHGRTSVTVQFHPVHRFTVSPVRPATVEVPKIGAVTVEDRGSRLRVAGRFTSKLPPENGLRLFLFDPQAHGFGKPTGTIKRNQLRSWLRTDEQPQPASESFIARRAIEDVSSLEWSAEFEREAAQPTAAQMQEPKKPVEMIVMGIATTSVSAEREADAEALAKRGAEEPAKK
jgi:Novel STAND NTPase 1